MNDVLEVKKLYTNMPGHIVFNF